jgi:hypothetical protein
MVEVSIDRSDLRRWVVCESGNRWVTAVRRFSPELMPKPLVSEIVPTTATEAIAELTASQDRPAVMLWESWHESLLPVCDQIILAASRCPTALQIVAAVDHTDRERAILQELPCVAIIRHPEDLAALKRLIRAYFRNHP